MLFSLQVAVVKRIAALGAELRRMCRISRFPAAFVALILRDTGRLGFAAFGAELALIHRAAAARPAVCLYFWLFCAAFGAELSGCRRAALRAFPASCRRLRLRLFAAAVRAEIAGDTALSAAARPAVRGRCRCCGSGLLCLLLRNPGQVLSREQLIENVWGYAFTGESRTVDVHVRTLRQKLGEAGAYIETVRGYGYKISPVN